MKKIVLCLLCSIFSYTLSAQTEKELQKLSWKEIATKMPAEWYGTDAARNIAGKLLLYQSDLGGFPKNIHFHRKIQQDVIDELKTSGIGTTIDNGATVNEMRFLTSMYAQTGDNLYKEAFLKALEYIYTSQYANGGWPQFYPARRGRSNAYSNNITFNDDAMVNVLKMLYAISDDDKPYNVLQFTPEQKARALEAYNKGIQCILDTQIRNKKGELTVWCAQHDPVTMLPAKARAYELVSYSGVESVNITLLLMDVENPSPEVIAAVQGAVKWFDEHKITDIIYRRTKVNGKYVATIEPAENASPIWARFYDIDTEKPFFCDRDGVKRNSIDELGDDRRNGYKWYDDKGIKVLKEYPEWLEEIGQQ